MIARLLSAVDAERELPRNEALVLHCTGDLIDDRPPKEPKLNVRLS
jgi:hypothetical protein